VGTHELFFLSGVLMAVGMSLSGLRSLRAAPVPTGYWTIAWAALLASGLVTLFGNTPGLDSSVAPALSSFFGPLTLAGSLQYVGKKPPVWLLPVAGAAAIACLLAPLLGLPAVEHVLALAFQPVLIVAAAGVLIGAKPRWLVVSLQLGLFGLAAISVVDAVRDLAVPRGEDPMVAWLVFGVPTALLQVAGGLEQARRRVAETESETRAFAERFDALLSSPADLPVLLFRPSGDFEQLHGATPEQLAKYGLEDTAAVLATPSQLISPEDQEATSSALEDVVRTERSRMISVEASFPAGLFAFEIALMPFHGEDGHIEAVMGVVHDVTEHVETVRQLRQTEQSLRALLTALAANRVVVIDAVGVIESIVGSLEHGETPYGVDYQSVEGLKVGDLVPGEGGARVLEAVQAIYRGGASRDLEEQVELPGGSFFFGISLRPLLDEDGAVEKVLAACTDVTERKELEARVLHAEKLKSLGILAGGIAHDFNNLLTGILGNASIALEESPGDGTVRQSLLDIESAGERAAQLTAQLLAYAGRAVVSPRTFDLSAFVQDMSPLLSTGVEGAAELRIQHEGPSAWVHADDGQLGQVIMNLVTNALESLPEGGGHVLVKTSVVQAAGGLLEQEAGLPDCLKREYACLMVKDTGSGMDADTMARIFDPFFTSKFEGRGLGLAAAQGIVRSHGGKMQVQSMPGQGTTFRVLLPCVDAPSVVAFPESDLQRRDRSIAGAVLVIDDEPSIRSLVGKFLEKLGHRYAVAASGLEGLALVVSEPEAFRVALIDLDMPGWSGERVCQELREHCEDLPVIFMTGHGEQTALERTRSFPRARILEKPFNLELLSQAVSELLDSR
jgi:signal transduction histidine kinase/CheY-like chemotaxis protein